MTPPIRQSRYARSQADVSRVSQMSADLTWVDGRLKVVGPGEAIHSVQFPVTFSKKPLPFFGGEVEFMASEAAMYPEITGVVTGWQVTSGNRYNGADISIRASGRPGQPLWLSYAFVGVALTNASQA